MQKGPLASGVNGWLLIKISVPKQRSRLMYIKILLDPYAKYCGPRRTHRSLITGRMFPEVFSQCQWPG